MTQIPSTSRDLLNLSYENRQRGNLDPLLYNSVVDGEGVPQDLFADSKLDTFFLDSLAAAANTVYTVPANKRAHFGTFQVINPTAGGIVVTSSILRGGLTSRLNSTSTPGANSGTSMAQCPFFVFEPGDKLILTPAAIGLSAFGTVILLPSNSRFKTIVKTTFSGTPQTFYEVPAGKNAFNVFGLANPSIGFIGSSSSNVINDSGGALTTKMYYVPAGQVLDIAKHQLINIAGPANGGQLRVDVMPRLMNPGDKIVIDTGSAAAGQMMYMSVYEF